MPRAPLAVACLTGVMLLGSVAPSAHDLPADVVVHLFVAPEGDRARVIVGVPMSAMGDIDYPTRGAAGLLDLSRIGPSLEAAVRLWLVPGLRLYEHGAPLVEPAVTAVRLSLASDGDWSTYERALAAFGRPAVPADTELFWNQGRLDAILDYPIRSDRSAFSIQPALARLGVRVRTALRFQPPGGALRAYEFVGDPGTIALDPGWLDAARSFVRRGFVHILEGADHLLFLLCLVVPVRRIRSLVPVVTAFAVGHSITLIASALDIAPSGLWFPPVIEALIAGSVFYMAIENVLAPRFDHRWIMAFGFGLVHGFGFAFALGESLQFAGAHLLTSLVAFNLGVELGQLAVLGLIVPPLGVLFRRAVSERVATIAVSAIVAHTAWHWMVDRVAVARQFSMAWPRLDAAFAAEAAGWLLVLVVAGGAFWLLTLGAGWVRRPISPPRPPRQ
jgi:hypothetical protein